MQTGIFGGTFNPIHLAHLRIAETVMHDCELDRLLFMPAAEPPHKEIAGATSFAHRRAMVEAAIKDRPGFFCSDLESRRKGKSFSVDTLEILRRENPDDRFYFIIGMDSWRDIASWREYQRIFGLTHLVIFPRPGVTLDEPLAPLPVASREEFCYADDSGRLRHSSGHELIFIRGEEFDIASTEIRSRVAAGEVIDKFVPPTVADYIAAHDLYRAAP